MSTELQPGELAEGQCPVGSQPMVSVGDAIPAGAKPKDQLFIVMKLGDDGKIFLAPLKTGQFQFTLPCSGSSTARFDFELKTIKKEELPERSPPLGLIRFEYPLWMWLALVGGVVFIALSTWGIFALVKRRLAKPKKQVAQQAPKQSPEEAFAHFLRSAPKLSEQDEPALVHELYSKGNDLLRPYLEQKLSFKASWATTGEFVGTLKTVALGYPALSSATALTETLLAQADLVRFSKDMPPKEHRQQFARQLKEIFDTVTKATAPNTPERGAAR